VRQLRRHWNAWKRAAGCAEIGIGGLASVLPGANIRAALKQSEGSAGYTAEWRRRLTACWAAVRYPRVASSNADGLRNLHLPLLQLLVGLHVN